MNLKKLFLPLLLLAAAIPSFASRPAVVAHRGYSILYYAKDNVYKSYPPYENSIYALQRADSVGADFCEFDVWITKDGGLFVNHDGIVNSLKDKEGNYIPIWNSTTAEVAAATMSNGQHIPSLNDYLDAAAKLNIGLILEVKTLGSGQDEAKANYEANSGVVDAVVKMVEEKGLDERTIYITFSNTLLEQLREKGKTVYTLNGSSPETLKELGSEGADFSMAYFKGDKTFIGDSDIINKVQAAGMPFNIWTVDLEADLRYFIDRGVDFITTNYPDRAINILNTIYSDKTVAPKVQSGYSLENISTLPAGIAPNVGTDVLYRSGIFVNDHYFVIQRSVPATGEVQTDSHGAVIIYDLDGKRVQTILPPSGYFVWTSANLDSSGHLLVQLDDHAFNGVNSTGNTHGFMAISTTPGADGKFEILKDFVPMGFSANDNPKGIDKTKSYRYDAMAPVYGNIFTDYNTRILSVFANTDYTNQQSYNSNQNASTEPTFWKGATITSNYGLSSMAGATAQTSTGYALEYLPANPQLNASGVPMTEVAILANPVKDITCSATGKFGNSIQNYVTPGNWKPVDAAHLNYYYTPMHASYTGFNIFALAGKDYIIYPATMNDGTNSGDAFAIAEVSFVPTAATDMTMPGETFVNNRPVGTLKAVFPGSGLAGNTSCAPSYTIEPGDAPNTVFINVFVPGSPASRWKFTVPDDDVHIADGVQDGFILTPQYSWAASLIPTGSSRQSVAMNDHLYVNQYTDDAVLVYDSQGKFVTKIDAPSINGVQYHNWTGCNVDAAGHIVVQLDKATFSSSAGIATQGGHALMVIDPNTNTVIKTMEFASASPQRFDAMSPIAKDIVNDTDVDIYCSLGGQTNSFRFTFNTSANGGNTVSAISTSHGLDTNFPNMTGTLQQNTGYIHNYTSVNNENTLAVYRNPHYQHTYSAEGKYGNGIIKYVFNANNVLQPMIYTQPEEVVSRADATDYTYYFTPMHSGLSGFNIFTLDGKEYIIYPARNPNGVTSEQNMPSDAFAIAEVSYVNTPLTDTTKPEETLTDGSPVGTLKAIYGGSGSTALTTNVPTYTVVPVADDSKSVDIYVANPGGPTSKYTFTSTGSPGTTSIDAIEASAPADADAPVEYYNLQGVRVHNPANGIFIKKQGSKATKIIM